MAKRRGAPVRPPLALPQGVGYLWALFVRLDARRGAGGFGPSPLTWADLVAFQTTTGVQLNAWELEMIEALDDCYMTVAAEAAAAAARKR